MDFIDGLDRWTPETLFRQYGWEQQRRDKEVAEKTKTAIRGELMRRLKKCFHELDEAKDGIEAGEIFKRYLNNEL